MPKKTNAAYDALEEQRAAQAVSVAESERRMNSSTPTPTQDENDRAKLGILEEDLADDGSGPDPANQPLVTPGTSTAATNRSVDTSNPAPASGGNIGSKKGG